MIDAIIPLAIFDIDTLLSWLDAAKFFNWFIDHANYWFVFIFMTIESSFIPFPSEVVVPPAAWLATQKGDMNIYMVGLAATAGAMVGSLINYYLAMWLGRPIIYKFADSRLGHACMLDTQKVDKAEKYFDKHGAISTFIGRLIPVIRQLISLPAGLARMNIGKFCLYTFLGAGIWNIVLVSLGAWLGTFVSQKDLFEFIEKYNGYLTWIGVAIGVICVGIILWNAFKPRKEQTKGQSC